MRTSKAFTLVEMAIVLVVVGLIAGGVLVAKTLIRSSEIKTVGTEYNSYTSAIQAFRDKYQGLPGDMLNATQFWGTAASCPGTSASPHLGTATCNGNGNSMMENNPSPVPPTSPANEIFTFWQQLGNARLIAGTYTGVDASGASNGTGHKTNVNCPRSKLHDNACWGTNFIGDILVSDTTYIEGAYGNAILFGMAPNGSTLPTASAAIGAPLRPQEAEDVDIKYDDGMAGNGNIVVPESALSKDCYTLSDGSIGASSTTVARTDILYNVSNNMPACALIFKSVY